VFVLPWTCVQGLYCFLQSPLRGPMGRSTTKSPSFQHIPMTTSLSEVRQTMNHRYWKIGTNLRSLSGGAAGNTLANRLTECNDTQVLLLEAGGRCVLLIVTYNSLNIQYWLSITATKVLLHPLFRAYVPLYHQTLWVVRVACFLFVDRLTSHTTGITLHPHNPVWMVVSFITPAEGFWVDRPQ